MINLIHKLYAVRDPTPSIELREELTASKLPTGHLYSGYRILTWDTYCPAPEINTKNK